MAIDMDTIVDFVAHYWGNLTRNIIKTVDGMTYIKYIRLIAIVGAYALLRPYIIKLGAKMQTKEHEKEIDVEEILGPKAKISPNVLRGYGGKEVEIAESESEGEGATTGSNWGKKARKRQRAHDKKLLAEVEERRRQLQEDDEDKDIEEYLIDGVDIRDHLVDYEEGVDGW
ncbi:hypothetical protein HYFRA_00001397 [Hymenoscyphus fraxineus]|uniref:DUF1531-domain-containing protein n=1 Tax=Hymenoscyphus fraxineus TaxID=746836 RepID=A0A9N9PY28_9HELO|nr:hypothetical protein HYFRA_00001397 [Hymenoscyphus fraxineus]